MYNIFIRNVGIYVAYICTCEVNLGAGTCMYIHNNLIILGYY